jgi:hypothetical protein
MLNNFTNTRPLMVVATLLLSITMVAAYADDDEHEGNERSMGSERHSSRPVDNDDEDRGGRGSSYTVSNAKWKEECGSCHLAYPPRLLSAESWRAVMSGLEKHFGSDASVDAASAAEIGDFLEKNASSRQHRSSNGVEPPLRISDTRWFKSEHREVSTRMWKNPKVKSPSNCAACHSKAESGSFNEHEVRMPK